MGDEEPGAIRFAKRFIHVSHDYDSDRFRLPHDGKMKWTPLFLVIVVIGLIDLVFAVDSIPAIFGITKDPFVVFTSNAFAILGLRSLYFLLADAKDRFHYLTPGLALVLIFILGGGPVAAVVAIALHTGGALGKQFSEVAENADLKPVEGLASVGANWSQRMWLGIIPQVAPNWLSYALLRFEINVRGAAVLGFVGAGGIGQTLLEVIRKFYYADVSALLVMIIATVMLIDAVTERVRHRILGQERSS